MRRATYTSAAHEGRPRPAWVSDDGASLIPVPNDVVAPEAGPLDWLDLDGVYWPRLVSAWRQGPSGEGLPIGHVPLLAPVPRPGKLLCIGLNYRDHAAETKLVIPERPLLFSKFSTAVIGPGAAIQVPATSSRVDYEAELAVVIGRRTKQVRPEDALGVVAGYTCLNDVSARDFQFSDKQWQRGKSCDTFAPMGPWLVTADVLGDAAALGIRLRLNGQTLQVSPPPSSSSAWPRSCRS